MKKPVAHQKLPSDWKERESLRDKGQFWTPSWVAEAMIEYVAEDTDLVFDPATGKGAFYTALLQKRKETVKFYGTDIDPEMLNDSVYKQSNCQVECRDFLMNPPARTFKAIIANPPYIRHHRLSEETKSYLKKLATRITGQPIDGRAGYHIYFLIQALSLLEKGGRLAFIMPADTCEGKFAPKLWKWISANFCIECAIVFNEKATPFPNVDTNAIVLLIKKAKPNPTLYWVRSREAYTDDLERFVYSKFALQKLDSIEVTVRALQEAMSTGLSRPVRSGEDFKYHLFDFARVMRGIATGSNAFFFLTSQQVNDLHLPRHFLKRGIGRTKDVTGDVITEKDLEILDKNNRPTFLFSINGHDTLPGAVLKYLEIGAQMGLPDRALIKQRKPWYKMEKREVPPLLFAYLGRRNSRFIKNDAGIVPLTGFLCIYPIIKNNVFVEHLWLALNHPDTLKNLQYVGKSYGSGAIKVEPQNLQRLPIPEHIVVQYNLIKPYESSAVQLEIFREEP